MNFKIRTKILLAFLLVIAICIVSIAINFFLLLSLDQKANHIFTSVDQAVIAAYDLQNAFNIDIKAIEEYGNGYASLDETEKIVTAAEEKVASSIEAIEREGEVPLTYVASLKSTLAKDETQDEVVFDLKKKEKNSSQVSLELHQALILFDTVTQETENDTNRIINYLNQHRTEDIKALSDEINTSRLYIIVAFAIAIVLSILTALMISSRLSVAIKKVRDAALKMSQGDFSQRISTTSKDEIGDLASAFDQMAESIEKSQTDLKESDDRLEKLNLDMSEKIVEFKKFNELTVGRELKMIELKEKLKECEDNLGKK